MARPRPVAAFGGAHLLTQSLDGGPILVQRSGSGGEIRRARPGQPDGLRPTATSDHPDALSWIGGDTQTTVVRRTDGVLLATTGTGPARRLMLPDVPTGPRWTRPSPPDPLENR